MVFIGREAMINYNNLWKLLIDKGLKKKELRGIIYLIEIK